MLLRLRIDLSHRLRFGRGPNRPKGPDGPGEGSQLEFAPHVTLPSCGRCGSRKDRWVRSRSCRSTSLRERSTSDHRPAGRAGHPTACTLKRISATVAREDGHKATGAISLPEAFQHCHRGPMTMSDTETLAACADGRRANPDLGLRPIEPPTLRRSSDSIHTSAPDRFSCAISTRTPSSNPPKSHTSPASMASTGWPTWSSTTARSSRSAVMTGLRIPALRRLPSSLPTNSRTTGWAPCSWSAWSRPQNGRGSARFKASVLAENSAMLAVFHGAGFLITHTRTLDVVELVMEMPTCREGGEGAPMTQAMAVCSMIPRDFSERDRPDEPRSTSRGRMDLE